MAFAISRLGQHTGELAQPWHCIDAAPQFPRDPVELLRARGNAYVREVIARLSQTAWLLDLSVYLSTLAKTVEWWTPQSPRPMASREPPPSDIVTTVPESIWGMSV
jgi:hypothetical protein